MVRKNLNQNNLNWIVKFWKAWKLGVKRRFGIKYQIFSCVTSCWFYGFSSKISLSPLYIYAYYIIIIDIIGLSLSLSLSLPIVIIIDIIVLKELMILLILYFISVCISISIYLHLYHLLYVDSIVSIKKLFISTLYLCL